MLKIVGFGSGSKENMTLEAVRAIQDSELVVGFRTYVELLKQYFPDKQYYSTNMMQEREKKRCWCAVGTAVYTAWRVWFMNWQKNPCRFR